MALNIDFLGTDFIVGTEFRDFNFGLGGDDFIDNRGGNDISFGGRGNDIFADDAFAPVTDETGNDINFGGSGDDIFGWQTGFDIMIGGSGFDEVELFYGDNAYNFNSLTPNIDLVRNVENGDIMIGIGIEVYEFFDFA